MDKIRMGLLGCGGMGTRHLYGLRELAGTPSNNVELCALCDIRRENAELAADEAEELLGTRPAVFTDLETMARDVPDLAMVDIVTDPSVHHTVVCQALDLGLHVLVEKPMAITVGACLQMLDAARRNNRLLSVAENYRRDPSARLVKYLLETGAIGTPYMATLHTLLPGTRIFITPWRHLKDKGGLLIDMGVHFTDLIRYQLGDVAEVYGDVRLVEPVRTKPEAVGPLGDRYKFYQARFRDMPAEVPATAEDTSVALFRMASGVTLSWIVGMGGHGDCSGQLILGDRGSLLGFGNRGGHIRLQRTGEGVLDQAAILNGTPEFVLEPLAEHFFPTRSTVEDSAVDWKIIALELYELARAILDDGEVEVDGVEGMKDVAAVYAICESAMAGRAVTMAEVETCAVYAYQAEIDVALGIGP